MANQTRTMTFDGESQSFILTGGGYPYSIKLSDCESPDKLKWWVKHLKEKTWFDKSQEQEFIKLWSSKTQLPAE